MYFPKLDILRINNIKAKYKLNDFLIDSFDSWLANQSELYYDYLNPLEFINDYGINKKLGLSIFSVSSSEEIFISKESSPLLRIKYIVDCPCCDENVNTYYNNKDIPNYEINCYEEQCTNFIPANHPEKINIYFELLENPILDSFENDILSVYEKKPLAPLTASDPDITEELWRLEEN
ncbi:hypothetical protein BN988_01611 [Oceanobacillus picturae]|uniref:Uncharacterized protein n=1 Tax=Oceanobacillus picturae TaxID=171693 RepID=W9AKD6_9BACI|nr:hypothetical protein [Oceanobacillus picturae]CDO03111.1 hypothetical protein BN988_01611 [Oceanobacillus picturae]